MLSVLSYNIRYGMKLSEIIEWLNTFGITFDIICLQEFPLTRIEEVLKEFKKFEFDYTYSHSFTKRDEPFGQLTLCNKKTIKIKNHTVINLGTSIIESRLSKSRGERSALITHLEHNKKQFTVANMHLVCFALNKQRLIQLQRVLGNINTLPNPESPIIMLGDFNYSSIVNQEKLFGFMQEHNFLNAYKLRTNRILFIRQQLDYVFYRNCEVSQIHMPKLRYSDHYPVYFSLNI